MSGQIQETRTTESLVRELEDFCGSEKLSIDALRDNVDRIPRNADIRNSSFLHMACLNERVSLRIIDCLLDAFPDAASFVDGDGCVPLHMACKNRNVDSDIIQLLVDVWPKAAAHADDERYLPIHHLCRNDWLEETASVNILKIFVKINNHIGIDQFQHAADDGVVDGSGSLPIHLALGGSDMSPEFCKMLIDACPESVRIQNSNGYLAIHKACTHLSTHYLAHWMNNHIVHPQWIHGQSILVKYLFQIYPEGVYVRTLDGCLPIDLVRVPTDDEFFYCESPLVRENLISIKSMGEFLERQMVYARKAQDPIIMTKLDSYGWLPLHQALHDNASLGAIKLLVKGNHWALRVADKKVSFPLHIACEFSSADVVKFLLELDDVFVNHYDSNKDSILHYACRGGNCGAVKYLLERHVSSASERNADGDLPFHLLCCARKDKVDRDSVEYVDTIWRLLLAYPMTVRFFA